MSFKSLLNQQITTYARNGYDAYGRESVGSATTVQARFQRTSKQRLQPNGTLMTIDGVVYIATASNIAIGDKITHDSNNYKVIGRYDAIDGTGNTQHVKLEVVKWLI